MATDTTTSTNFFGSSGPLGAVTNYLSGNNPPTPADTQTTKTTPASNAPQYSDQFIAPTTAPTPAKTPTPTQVPPVGGAITPQPDISKQFARIGTDVYALNPDGSLGNYLSYNDYKSIYAPKGLNLGNVSQYDTSKLTQAQKDSINNAAIQRGETPPISAIKTPAPGSVSAREFLGATGQTIQHPSTMTQSDLDTHLNNQITAIKYGGTPGSQTVVQGQADNGNNSYYKSWNTDTQTWDIFNVADNTPVDQATFQSKGLNAANINTAEGLNTLGITTGHSTGAPITGGNPNTGTDVTSKNAQLTKQADDLTKQINDLSSQSPFAAQNVVQLRQSLNDSSGLSKLYSDRLNIMGQINNITNVFEKVGSEISNSRNLEQTLKSKRMQYLDSKQQLQLDSLNRTLTLINQQITDTEKNVTNTMSDTVQQYNIWDKQMTELRNQYDKIVGLEDKISDNARSAMDTLAANPDLLQGMTSSELQFITDNGYFPTSMMERWSTTLKTKVQGVLKNDLTGNIYTYDKDGNVKLVGNIGAGGTSSVTHQLIQQNDGSYADVVTDKSTGAVISSTIVPGLTGGNANNQTFIKTSFFDWLANPNISGKYTVQQLEDAAARANFGFDVTKSTDVVQAIKNHAGTGFGIFHPLGGTGTLDSSAPDAITAFATYLKQGNVNTTGGTTGTGGGSIPKGTDGAAYGHPGFVSDGTQWVAK